MSILALESVGLPGIYADLGIWDHIAESGSDVPNSKCAFYVSLLVS